MLFYQQVTVAFLFQHPHAHTHIYNFISYMLCIYIFSIFNLFQTMVYLIHFSKSFREEQTDQTITHKTGVMEGGKKRNKK